MPTGTRPGLRLAFLRVAEKPLPLLHGPAVDFTPPIGDKRWAHSTQLPQGEQAPAPLPFKGPPRKQLLRPREFQRLRARRNPALSCR